MFKKLPRNPWLLFSPFLLYYAYIIIKNKWPTLYGDEIRYVDFARNLLHGFYSPPAPHNNLWNGPGYPIILMPFVGFNVLDICTTMLNALFMYAAVVFLYKALNLVANNKIALVFALLLAVYPNAMSMLPILYTEAFTGLLVSSLVYTVALFYVGEKPKHGVITGLILGYLILTKIIFGYVIVICLAVTLIAFLIAKTKLFI